MNTHPTPTRPTSRRALAGLFAVGAVAISLLAASPALADEAAPGQSCWTNVDTGETGCFDSSLDPQDQIEIATGKPVVGEPTGTETSARSAAVAADDTLFMLVTGYDSTGRTGDSNTYFTSNTLQCTGPNYGFQNLGVWIDRFESIQSYNGCLTTLYDAVDFDGATFEVTVSDDLGTFKNRAASLDVG